MRPKFIEVKTRNSFRFINLKKIDNVSISTTGDAIIRTKEEEIYTAEKYEDVKNLIRLLTE